MVAEVPLWPRGERGVYNEALPESWCRQPGAVTVVAEVPLWPEGYVLPLEQAFWLFSAENKFISIQVTKP